MKLEQAIHQRIQDFSEEKNIVIEIPTGNETTVDDIEQICSNLKISVADFFCSNLFRNLDKA